MKNDRRGFLRAAAAFGVASFATLGGPLRAEQPIKDGKNNEPAEEISAPEDLMREHGVLDRILLIYEEDMRRLRSKAEVPPDVFRFARGCLSIAFALLPVPLALILVAFGA
jgi:hypothetical protein